MHFLLPGSTYWRERVEHLKHSATQNGSAEHDVALVALRNWSWRGIHLPLPQQKSNVQSAKVWKLSTKLLGESGKEEFADMYVTSGTHGLKNEGFFLETFTSSPVVSPVSSPLDLRSFLHPSCNIAIWMLGITKRCVWIFFRFNTSRDEIVCKLSLFFPAPAALVLVQ